MHRSLADGGEGVHIRAMVRALRERGHTLQVHGPGGDALTDPGAVTGRTRVSAVLSRAPRRVVEFGEVIYGKIDALRACSAARHFRPDIVYARHAAHTVAPLQAGEAAGAPIFLEVNAPLALERAQDELRPLRFPGLARRYEQRCFNGADMVLVVSSPLRDYLRQCGVTGPIEVIPNAIHRDDYRQLADGSEIRTNLGIPRAAVVFGWVGFMRAWHGLEMLLEAASTIAEQWPKTPIFVLLVGDGPALAELERRGPTIASPARLALAGRVEHAQIPQYLAAMDITVSPRATFYACPLKLLEYLAIGKPVVAPHTANVLDVLIPETDGLTFEPENLLALTEVLERLAHDSELCRRLGAAGRDRVLREHTWDHNARRVEELAREFGYRDEAPREATTPRPC